MKPNATEKQKRRYELQTNRGELQKQIYTLRRELNELEDVVLEHPASYNEAINLAMPHIRNLHKSAPDDIPAIFLGNSEDVVMLRSKTEKKKTVKYLNSRGKCYLRSRGLTLHEVAELDADAAKQIRENPEHFWVVCVTDEECFAHLLL